MPKPDDPPEGDIKRIPIPFTPELLKEIDDYRYEARIPSRAEAIRRLLRSALDALQGKAASSRGKS